MDNSEFRKNVEETISEQKQWYPIEVVAEQAPIIRVVSMIILQAIKQSASEMKIDFLPAESITSYLIDGKWHEELRVPEYVSPPLIERLRMMADLEGEISAEKEEGTIPVRCDNMDYQLGLTHTRTDRGEQIVIRFL